MTEGDKKVFYLITAVVILFGVGCFEETAVINPSQKITPPLAQLEILDPGLATTTNAGEIVIKGTTDAERVLIAGQYHETTNGEFNAELELEEGDNRFPVAVGNGVATTTIIVNVTKITK